jgi:hypothetical protein
MFVNVQDEVQKRSDDVHGRALSPANTCRLQVSKANCALNHQTQIAEFVLHLI